MKLIETTERIETAKARKTEIENEIESLNSELTEINEKVSTANEEGITRLLSRKSEIHARLEVLRLVRQDDTGAHALAWW